jgi:hypothetical protein
MLHLWLDLGRLRSNWLDSTHAVWQRFTSILRKKSWSTVAASLRVRLSSTWLDSTHAVRQMYTEILRKTNLPLQHFLKSECDRLDLCCVVKMRWNSNQNKWDYLWSVFVSYTHFDSSQLHSCKCDYRRQGSWAKEMVLALYHLWESNWARLDSTTLTHRDRATQEFYAKQMCLPLQHLYRLHTHKLMQSDRVTQQFYTKHMGQPMNHLCESYSVWHESTRLMHCDNRTQEFYSKHFDVPL